MIVVQIEAETFDGLWQAWEDMLESADLQNLGGRFGQVGVITDTYCWDARSEDSAECS